MAKPTDSRQKKLTELKKNVEQSHDYFKKNYDRFQEFMRFIYYTSLSTAEINLLQELQKPQIEFNFIEAYISRLEGEFMQLDPAFSVRAMDGVVIGNPAMIAVVEAHLKACFSAPDKDALASQFYRDILSGGFSVGKVYTDYKNSKSFDQEIFVERVFDPTLCGFDPLARESHKGDGRYSYELYPKTKEQVKNLYGNDAVKNMNFSRNLDGFNWSYINQHEEIVLLADYFCKKEKEAVVLKLSSGHVVTEKEYEKFLQQWEDSGVIQQAPVVVNKRKSTITTIERYIFNDSNVLDYEMTDYVMLPHVFFDGNSVTLRDTTQSESRQMTRPYVYQARDIQKLRNYAGQTLANEIENMVMHKWKAAVESIPDNADYQIAYEDPQKASVILYNAFKDNNPDHPLPPPQEIQRTPIPPEIANTFMLTEQMVKSALGSYDAAQGRQGDAMSGIALRRGATNSNQASKPYLQGFINGWNRLGQVYLSLLPKYYVTPRTIPVVSPTGERGYVDINKPGTVKFNYDVETLQVQVEAGVNYELQKEIALETIIKMMQSSETFNQFINQEGLEVLIDNLDIRGVDTLKVMAKQFMEQMKQQQAAAAQKAQSMPTPQELAVKELQLKEQKQQDEAKQAQVDTMVQLQKISDDNAVKNKQADADIMKVMVDATGQVDDRMLQQEKTDAENARTAVEMATHVAAENRAAQKHAKEMSEPTGE